MRSAPLQDFRQRSLFHFGPQAALGRTRVARAQPNWSSTAGNLDPLAAIGQQPNDESYLALPEQRLDRSHDPGLAADLDLIADLKCPVRIKTPQIAISVAFAESRARRGSNRSSPSEGPAAATSRGRLSGPPADSTRDA
jgi:hypothetical protein